MSFIYFNSLSQEEEFWKDVAEQPKKEIIKKRTLGLRFNVLNSNRMRKFEKFILKHNKSSLNKSQGCISQKKLIEKIDRMILLGKRNDENRRRMYEQHLKERESIDVSNCTFYPNIHHYPIKRLLKTTTVMSKISPSASKMNNSSYYEKSQIWSRNLKGKKAKIKQTIQLQTQQYSFTPHIKQRSLDILFNKVNSNVFLPHNSNFLRTQANNKKKRNTSSQMTLTHSAEKKTKTTCTSRSLSFFCSIEALKNELRNSCANLKEEEELE